MEDLFTLIKNDLSELTLAIEDLERKLLVYKSAFNILKDLSTCNTCRNHGVCPMERGLGEKVRYDCFFFIKDERVK